MANRLWDKRRQAVYVLLKKIRVDTGFTQLELAEALDKPQSYVSKFETGERKLDFIEVADICRVLDYSLQLFCEEYEANIK